MWSMGKTVDPIDSYSCENTSVFKFPALKDILLKGIGPKLWKLAPNRRCQYRHPTTELASRDSVLQNTHCFELNVHIC
jgi:hypothetical protein